MSIVDENGDYMSSSTTTTTTTTTTKKTTKFTSSSVKNPLAAVRSTDSTQALLSAPVLPPSSPLLNESVSRDIASKRCIEEFHLPNNSKEFYYGNICLSIVFAWLIEKKVFRIFINKRKMIGCDHSHFSHRHIDMATAPSLTAPIVLLCSFNSIHRAAKSLVAVWAELCTRIAATIWLRAQLRAAVVKMEKEERNVRRGRGKSTSSSRWLASLW